MKNPAPIKPDAERCARRFGCTVQQVKRLLAKNAAGLRAMAAKAARTGKPVNGYTEAELRASARDYQEAAR